MMQGRKAFSLVEAAVIVVILGVLAAFAVPAVLAAAERKKAVEAFDYLLAVQDAQTRHLTREGKFAGDLNSLDLQAALPAHYTPGPIAAGRSGSLAGSWSLTLTRAGSAAGYDGYTVTFTEQGFDPDKSTISDHPTISPLKDS